MNNKLRLKVTGKTKKYFLNEIIKNNINIYDLKENKNNYELLINYFDYEKLLNIKTTNKIEIIKRLGLNNYLNYIKKNIIVITFIILGVLLNILLSNMILDIEIKHSNKEIKKIIKKDLKEYGLSKYKFKISYEEKELIKEKILDKEKDKIDWLEIEEKGTKYIIKLEERKKEDVVACNPRNIVSTKEAIITINAGIRTLPGITPRSREIIRLLSANTTAVVSPIPKPLMADVVTANVGHIPSIKTKVGFSFSKPLYKRSPTESFRISVTSLHQIFQNYRNRTIYCIHNSYSCNGCTTDGIDFTF